MPIGAWAAVHPWCDVATWTPPAAVPSGAGTTPGSPGTGL